MAFTRFPDPTNNISNLANQPVEPPATLKQKFDQVGEDLKDWANNTFLPELESTTNGDSGADNIGATALSGGVATTVQGIVEELDAKVVSGVGALNTHKSSADHDGRYFTEAETTALLLANQQGNHLGTWQGYSPVQSDPGIQAIVNSHTEQLADNVNRNNSEAINVKYPPTGLTGAIGDGIADDTTVLQATLDYAALTRKSVYFPSGTYKVTGLIVKTTIFGENAYKTVIKNVSAVNPCIKIQGHWFDIKDLSIFGNGTTIHPNDGTSGDGIYYDAANSPGAYVAYVNVINCYVMRNGGHGITFSGDCFIINIDSCVCNFNKKNGVNIDNSDSGQKNIINVSQCDLSDNDGNGILAFGTIININNNTIEGNLKKGVSLDCEDTAASIESGILTVNIKENYFELNKRGHIYIRGGIYAGPIYRDINTVTIGGNYGSQAITDFEAGYDTLVKVVSTGTQEYDSRIYNIRYDHNYFTISAGVVVFDGGNVLRDDTSTVYAALNPAYYKNFGRAVTPSQLRYKSINGYFFAKGVTYTTPLKSDNVVTGSIIYYPLMLPTGAKLRRIFLYVNTDSTNYNIRIETLGRNGRSIDAFANIIISDSINNNLSGNQTITTSGPEDFGKLARIPDNMSEVMLKVTVTRTVVGTYLYLGSPELQYLD